MIKINNYESFGECLQSYRKKARLTQIELANILSVQPQTIWRWEHNERKPSLEIIKKLSEVLSCTETELLNGQYGDKIKITLSWQWEEFTKGEINMDANKFNLFLGDDGQIGLHGAGMMTTRDAINEFLARVKEQIEIAYEAQIKRGVIKEAL